MESYQAEMAPNSRNDPYKNIQYIDIGSNIQFVYLHAIYSIVFFFPQGFGLQVNGPENAVYGHFNPISATTRWKQILTGSVYGFCGIAPVCFSKQGVW